MAFVVSCPGRFASLLEADKSYVRSHQDVGEAIVVIGGGVKVFLIRQCFLEAGLQICQNFQLVI